jgi:acyl-CoA dehydrogenase
VIDFEIPRELAELRDRVEGFVVDKIIPYENDKRQTAHGASEALRRELVELSRAAGLLSPHGPKEFGGLGLDHRGMAVVFEAAG